MPCPFCTLPDSRYVLSNDLVVAIRDGFPVSPGHTLVIPRRHVATWFDANAWEQQAIWQAVAQVKEALDAELQPDGYNVGFNAGVAAGQTVMHLHVHVIPRFANDMADPRGGVRGVIPEKQRYDPSAPPTDSDDPFVDLAPFVPGQDAHFLPVLRQAMRRALEIDLVSAFVQKSGLDRLEGDLVDALTRGAHVRVLTGDYLGVTHPHALQRLYTLATAHEAFSARLYRCGPGESFHPKAYLFTRGVHGVAFVGSSNLSQTALTHGVEWNLKTTRSGASTFATLRQRFDTLFDTAEPLSPALLDSYQHRVRVEPAPEPAAPPPAPRDLQKLVLVKLKEARAGGHTRGLVVMATGLGKTFLSAFDFAQQEGRRALFVAHREEILRQAADAWALVHPDRSIGFLTGGDKTPEADLLFASVQTLSRAHHLKGIDPRHFDYVVIDEFHHAAAASYRKLLAHFEPAYLLGLTATPDRLDGAALLNLCDDNLVARIGLVEGIARKDLVPFKYYGVRDDLDFSTIPWRSGRFDTAELTKATATQDRADQALREYRAKAPEVRRSLIFCCSQAHADFIADAFTRAGVPAAAVHAGPSSAPRAESLDRLRDGTLEAIVAVDIFNEGVDLPDVNLILMLRPTESPVIFLQQLGRGLRQGKTLPKPHLTVIDFIGNHRSFLVKPQALVALTGQTVVPGDALRRIREGLLGLPEGCEVDIEVEALDLLAKVAKLSQKDALLHTYLQLRDSYGHRPSAAQLYAASANFSPVKQQFGTWFDLLASFADLTDEEQAVLDAYRAWFTDLTNTPMSRSYKMVALAVLDDLDVLHGHIDAGLLASRCRAYLRRDPLLRTELSESEDLGDLEFASRWRQMPLKIFHEAKGMSRQWFALEDDLFVSRLDVAPAHQNVFDAMTSEIVAMRLAEHIDRRVRYADTVLPFAAPIELVVSHARGNPILRLDRARRPDTPDGWTAVDVDGEPYELDFQRSRVVAATSRAGGPNLLPQLLRRFFGPTAGQPGTRQRVELARLGERWNLRRRRAGAPAQIIPLGQLPYYSELAVACGVATAQFEGHDVSVPLSIEATRAVDPKRHFVVRASGDSMNGGELPIRDGDLVLCQWLDVTDLREVEGKAVLLTGGTGDEVLTALKIPVPNGRHWRLHSTNPDFADQDVDPGASLRIVARALEVVNERTGPVLWGQYDRDAIAPLFGQKNNPSWRSDHKDLEVHGQPHTILMVNLRKPPGTPIEHRYADQFLSASELQWESQATTAPDSAKGERVLHHRHQGRQIHLFVRYHTKKADGKGEPFVYCGTLQYQRHEGSMPVRVWFDLDQPLPEGLWHVWGGLG